MKLLFFCPRWGSDSLDWESFIEKAKNQGFNGVEFGVPSTIEASELDMIFNLLDAQQMLAIPQHYETTAPDFRQHEEQYCKWFEKILPYKPLKINSQTGRDIFSLQQNGVLFEHADRYAKAMGTEVCHETHRGKFSFAAHVTANYLREYPNLFLTLDISHWLCVAESFLTDQEEAVNLAIARTSHFHARIGHTQGPQVTDPRAPEWQEALSRHLLWWDQLVSRYMDTNQPLTVTPEFGPYPYMLNKPFTDNPLANQWEINVYMMELLTNRHLKT